MELLAAYGRARFSRDGIGTFIDDHGAAISEPGYFELVQLSSGDLLGVRLTKNFDGLGGRFLSFSGLSAGNPPESILCAGRTVRTRWAMRPGFDHVDVVMTPTAATVFAEGLEPDSVRTGTAALLNYFGHSTEISVPGLKAQFEALESTRGNADVYSTGGGVFHTHDVVVEGEISPSSPHGPLIAMELALSLERGTRVDHFELKGTDQEGRSARWLWSPSPQTKATQPFGITESIDAQALLTAMLRRSALAIDSRYPVPALVSHYLQACNFGTTHVGRGLAAASLIDTLRLCFETRDGVARFPVEKGARRTVREAAEAAGTKLIHEMELSEGDQLAVLENLRGALSGFGRSTFRAWVTDIMERERVLSREEDRQWLARLVTAARNKLVHEGRYASFKEDRLDEACQWEALTFVGAALLCRWLGYTEGFGTLTEVVVQLLGGDLSEPAE